MNTDQDSFPEAIILNNEIHLFYKLDHFHFDDGPTIRLGDIAGHADNQNIDVAPLDQIPALCSRYAETEIWNPVFTDSGQGASNQSTAISTDLHDAVRDLVSGQRPELLRRWRLSPIADRFLQRADLYEAEVGRDDRHRKFPGLELGKAAKIRLGLPEKDPFWFRLNIDDLEVVKFATGVAFLIARLQVLMAGGSSLTTKELAEAVHAVSRINTCKWRDFQTNMPVDGPEFTLGKLLRAFAQPTQSATLLANRVTSHVCAQLNAPLPTADLDFLASYYSRRYTTDYALDPNAVDIERLTDFTNVRHAISEEGVASVLAPARNKELPKFLQTWQTTSLRATYIPTMLLLLHENWFLSQSRNSASALNGQVDELDALESIVNDAMIFRLDYRFPSYSDISMHNQIANAMRRKLSLDRKLHEMQDDVTAMAERLAGERAKMRAEFEKRRHENYSWVGRTSTSVIAWLTAFTISKEVLGALVEPVTEGGAAGLPNAAQHSQAILGLSIFFGCVFFALSWRFSQLRLRDKVDQGPAPPFILRLRSAMAARFKR